MRTSFAVVLLTGMAWAQSDTGMPCNTVDYDNASGNPKLCTVEYDESDGPCPPPKAAVPDKAAAPKSTMTMNVMPVTIIGGGAKHGSNCHGNECRARPQEREAGRCAVRYIVIAYDKTSVSMEAK